MCLECTKRKEAPDVLSCSHPGGCSAGLAVEIDGPEFAGYPVSLPAALWCPSARSAAGLLLSFTGGPGGAARAGEPGAGIHVGDRSTISSAAHAPPTGGGAEPIRTGGRNGAREGSHCGDQPTSSERAWRGGKRPGEQGHECSRAATGSARKRTWWRSRSPLQLQLATLFAASPRLDDPAGEGAAGRAAPLGHIREAPQQSRKDGIVVRNARMRSVSDQEGFAISSQELGTLFSERGTHRSLLMSQRQERGSNIFAQNSSSHCVFQGASRYLIEGGQYVRHSHPTVYRERHQLFS